MARNGYKIFDSDTHVGPVMDVLEKHLASAEKAKLPGWEQFKATNKGGHVTYTKGQRRYRRRLGTAKPEETPGGYMAGFTGVKKKKEVSPLVDQDPAERIKDMDYEGVDVNLTLPSGWFGTWTAGDDPALLLLPAAALLYTLMTVDSALRHFGFDVRVTATGRDALKQLEEFAPDVMLLDVQGDPGTDDFVKSLRSRA